ncbi:MAG: D-alanyl-D-alanine carboxypeptidase family protein [Microbacteriaceae bacterium]
MSTPQQQHRPSAAVYRRRRLVAGLLSLVVLGGGIWGVGWTIASAVRPLPAAAITLDQASPIIGEPASLDLPDNARTAVSASGFDGLLAHSGDQGQAPIASITKIVTALVVLNAKPIDGAGEGPTITFGEADVQIRNQVIAENGSNAPVSAGLQLSEREALTVMLLPSANNYAISLANWAFGSTEAFNTAAADWLSANQLADTHIVEPTGLSPLNVSSPANLVHLGQLAQANPVIASIVVQPSADVAGVGVVENTNTLLGQAGVIGIKTGTTDEAGSCLLYAANVVVGAHTVLVIGVELGGASHEAVDDDVLSLIASLADSLREVPVAVTNQAVANAETMWGQHSALLATTNASVVAFGNLPVTVTIEQADFSTANAGQQVATMVATSGTQRVEAALTAETELSDPGLWWRLGHSGELR